MLLEGIQESTRWVQEAPRALQVALAGKTVVHQDLSLPDISVIIRAFEDGGELAALAKVHELHQALLADAGFREQFEVRWKGSGRLPIMKEVIAAYDAGLYFVAIPPALAQAEGVVATFFGLSSINYPELKRRVRALHDVDDLFEPVVMSFIDGLLVPFQHGSPVPQLNRHAVQHGGDKAYGTRSNAVAAIIWADYILGVTVEVTTRRASLRSSP
jgi:hypothetical protein